MGQSILLGASPSRGRCWRRLCVFVVTLLIALPLVEAVVRLRLFWRTGSFEVAHRFVLDEETGMRIPGPGRITATSVIDSRGFRSPEVVMPKPDGRLRIAFLGGSTTFCAEVTGNANTWPALVVQGLRDAHPNADIDWINASAAGWAADSSLESFEVCVAPLAPDVVVIYHATNDLTVDTRDLAMAQGLYTEGQGHGGDSWLRSHSLAWDLLLKNLEFRSRLNRAAHASRTLAFAPSDITEPFRARLTDLVRGAKNVAKEVVLITFAHRIRAGQDSEEQLRAARSAIYYMPFLSPGDLLAGFDFENRVIREVAAAEGVILVDGEDEIPADWAHFTDAVHLSETGCRVMAERCLSRLRADPSLQALLEPGGGK